MDVNLINSLSGPASALVASAMVAVWLNKRDKEHTAQLIELYKELRELSIQSTKAIENNTRVVDTLVLNDTSIRDKQDQIYVMVNSILENVKK
jgi:hypothetical protein